MFSGYKDATSCYTDQSVFDNRNQASFLPGDASKQTSGPPWDYTQQPFSAVPCYAGDQNMNHRHSTAIHNPQVVPQFENNNVVAHYKSISTGNNSHQSVVRPRAVINCQSSCNACYSHSVARVPHSWNPPPAESIRYITGNSSAPLSGDEISRFAPNLPSFSQHEDCSRRFSGGFASQLTKLSKFSKDHSPSILSTVAPKNDVLSPTEDCSVLRPQHHPSRVEPMPEKYIPPLSSESVPVKKDLCVTCRGVCTRPNCKSYHQQTIKFPNLEPIPIQQYGVPRENVVRYSGQAASTLNTGSSSCNQWHQSPGLWLQNGHPPGFWMPASEDIHGMGNAGITNFWNDRNSCEISSQQVPLPQNYHDGASNKTIGQGRIQPLQQQKGIGTVHEGERSDRLHPNMTQRYQKVTEVAQRSSEMPVRQKGPEEIAVSQTCQELLPRRSQQLEAVVECGIQYRQDMVSRHQTPMVKSQVETQSRKDDQGRCEPTNTITSELCHQDVTRSHINSGGIDSGLALPNFPPTSVEMRTDQMNQDISRRFQSTNFSSYLPHETKVSSSSSSNYSAVLGIAQPPSRFSSNITYTQSKISRSNNCRRLFSESCTEDSYNPSQSGDMVRNGFVSNRTTTANTLEASGTSHQHIPYHNKEISNTGVKCAVQIGSPSNHSLPPDSIIRYGNMKDSREVPKIITNSASIAASQMSPHLQSCGRMSSDSEASYHSGSTTMQVVEMNPSCSLGSSAGLSVDPKLSYISSPQNRQDSVVARSQHVRYQNVLAGTISEDVPACNMFCGNNSSMLHPGLFDLGKNLSNTHTSGTKAAMINRSFKENFNVTSRDIYPQSNMSALADGLKQHLLPRMDDTGASRPIKKRKPRTKSMVKPDHVELVGKLLHQESSSLHTTLTPVLDVRQFLATWDEETDVLSPAPKLPDVVLSNSTTDNPLLVLDCRHLNTNGVATLSAVDRNSLSDGHQAENFIPLYQQQLASPSESSSTSSDATKHNGQILQESSNDSVAQRLGECPSLIPIDPDRMEKFGPPNNCNKSLASMLEKNKPPLYEIQEREPSTPNGGSESCVSKSDSVGSFVESSGISVKSNIHSSLDNVSTKSTVSDSISLHECCTPTGSLPSRTGSFTDDCDNFCEKEKTSGTDSQHSFVVQDESRNRSDSCQNVQQKSNSESKDCDCSIPPQELPLSCGEIQHVMPISTQEKRQADCHPVQDHGIKESQSLVCSNGRAVHTLKALCMNVIECSTNVQQAFERGVCSHSKTSVRRFSEGEVQGLEAELCCSLSDYKAIEKTYAENGHSVVESKHITDIHKSENTSAKGETISVLESTGISCLSDEINTSESQISSNETANNKKKVLCQQTENASGTEESVKHTLNCEELVKQKATAGTNSCTTEISQSESGNLTRTVKTEGKANSPAVKLFDEAQPSSRINIKPLTSDMLLDADITLAGRPVSPNVRAEKCPKIHLPHSGTEQDTATSISEKEPVMTYQEEIQLSEKGLKSCSAEPVKPSISGTELHDVSVSVTSNPEKSHLNLLSYSSDTGDDLDMSVTSSTPATPVILDEVNEESSNEELVTVYEDSVSSDLESEPSDCISFSSLPCISKKSSHADAQSDHTLRILESLNGSPTVSGTVDESFPHLVEEKFNPEILSDNRAEMARMCSLKMSDKGDNEKCVLISSSQTESLRSNVEPLACSENNFDVPQSSGKDTQTQPMKSPLCPLLEVNHISDVSAARIQDDSATSDVVPSQTVLNIAVPDSKTTSCDVRLHSESKGENFSEFVKAFHNSTVEASNILHGQEPVTNVSADRSGYSDSGTKGDCLLFSEPVVDEKHNNSTSLLCDIPAIREDSSQQSENGISIGETSSHVLSDTSIVLHEELDLKLPENKMDLLSEKQISLNASVKNIPVSTLTPFNGGHSLVMNEEGKRQQEDPSLLNDSSVVLTSSSSDNLMLGTSELAVSTDMEDTLKVNDGFQCPEVSACGHPEILCNSSSRQLLTEEIGNDASEVLLLQEGSTAIERLELLKNYETVNKSVLKTAVSCPDNLTSSVKVLESSHCCDESVEVIQLHQHDTCVKGKLNSAAVCDKNPECLSVPPECSGSSSSTDMVIRNENMSQTRAKGLKGFVSHNEDDCNLFTQLKPAVSHDENKSVVPLVSESQDTPPDFSLQQQEFHDLHVENKLSIPADEEKNELNYKINSGNITADPQSSDLLFVSSAELAPVQDNILMVNSQKTTVLKSLTELDQTPDELVSEVVPHDHPAVTCESPGTKIPCKDTVVSDCEALCNLEPINLSMNTSLKWQDDSNTEENFIAGSNRSYDDVRSQSVEHLCRNLSTHISHNEQKNAADRRDDDMDRSKGDSTADNDGSISCEGEDVVLKHPIFDDPDAGNNAIHVSTIASSPLNIDKHDHNVAVNVAVAREDGDKYNTDVCIEDVAVTAATAEGGGDDVDTAYITSPTREPDTAGNMDNYTPNAQNNVSCVNVIRSVTDPDTVAVTITTSTTITTTTAATDSTTTSDSSNVGTTAAAVASAAMTTATTTTTTTTTATTTNTASTTSITEYVSTGNNMNTAVAVEVSVNTAAFIAATSTVATVIAAAATIATYTTTATTATTTTTTTTTTAAAATTTTTAAAAATTTTDIATTLTGCTDITTMVAAVTTANTTAGDGSGSDKSSEVTNTLVSCSTEEGLQHATGSGCSSTSQVANMSQEMEQNDTDKEQRFIIGMVTSGSLTSDEENTVKMPVNINTTENKEYCQQEGEGETTLKLKMEQNSKPSTEYNHNQSQKSTTTCRMSASVADVSHDSDHTKYGDTRGQSGNADTVDSISQQHCGTSQEQFNHFEMDTTTANMRPMKLQCKSAAEPTKDELNNYTCKVCDDSSAVSVWEECLSEEEVHNKINNCAFDMSHDIPVHQDKHICLEEPIKDEIGNSEVNIPAETPVHPEWKSADTIIKNEVNCEINIVSDNTFISQECHSSLDLNKEEIVDFKINAPENFSSTVLTEQDSSEGLDRSRITTVLHESAGSSPKDEHLSLQDGSGGGGGGGDVEDDNDNENDDDVMSDSRQSSQRSGMVHNNTSTPSSTRMNVELTQTNMSGQNSPDRQEVDLSVDTDEMPHLEVIDTEVSPHSSDSLEMPCLELITDPVESLGSHQVQYLGNTCASNRNSHPGHILPDDKEKNAQEDFTEPEEGVVHGLQENNTLILEATVSSMHSVSKSKGDVLLQDQVNSVNSELSEKTISLLSTPCKDSVRLERADATKDSVIHKDPSEEDNFLFASHNSSILQGNQDRYLSLTAPVTEESDISLEKAVECEIREVPVIPSALQVLSTYLDSDTASVKVVEVSPEYVQVLQSDVPHEWESLHLVTSDAECGQSGEKSQEHTAEATMDEEMLALADVEQAWPSCNLENESLGSSVGLNVSGGEASPSIESDSMCSAGKETDALISEHSENVNLAAAALQDTSDEPSSLVYTEMLPALGPSLGDVLPVDSVSNWPYLEEEVFSEFPSAPIDSSSLSVGAPLTPLQSITSSNSRDTAESEESFSSDSGSRYSFGSQSGSNDTALAVNGLKCRLSWKKIFALSKADKKKKKKKEESKHEENLEVIKENFNCCAKSKHEWKEYSDICCTDGGTELVDKCERLNGNLKTQLHVKNKGIHGLELGPAKIEVRLAPTPSPRGHLKTWQVVDDPKAERTVNWRRSNNILLNSCAGNSSCRNVASDVDPLPTEVTQTPIVLVKRLILKRRCDDESDADSNTKSKRLDKDESSDPIVGNLDNDKFTKVTVLSEHVHEAYDTVTPHGERLEDSEHINCHLEKCDLSNSSLTASNNDTQANSIAYGSCSESEEDRRSHVSAESCIQKAGRKLKVFKYDSSSSITLSEMNIADGIDPSPGTNKTSDMCFDDSKLGDFSINSDTGFGELDATNSCLANEDTSKQQLPRVIIKRTVGMGNTNKYQSFLRGVSCSSDSSSQWQPVVRLERNLSIDKLAKTSTVNNRTLEIAEVLDSLHHGHESPLDQPHVTLVSLPEVDCSSGDQNRSPSVATRKRRNGTFLPRVNKQQGDLNDGLNAQRCARKLTTFRSSFWVRHDTCPTPLAKDTRQLSSAKSHLSQRSPSIKLKFFSSCNKVQNRTLKMERKKGITQDVGDEYVVVENRNYTKDNMTKITFQRHKRKEVSIEDECENVETKVKEFVSAQNIPAVLNQHSHAEVQAVHDVSAACSEGRIIASNLTASKKRLSTEVDQESSGRELHQSCKKHVSDVSHFIISAKKNITAALKDAGDMVSEVSSENAMTSLNDKPSAEVWPGTKQSAITTNDNCPKSSNTKKRRYYEDMYFEKDVLPLFQPERILSISSTKKKRTIVKETSPQVDGKTLEEEIISLSTEPALDYNEIVPKQQTKETDREVREGQNCSRDESFGRLPDSEECPREKMSSKIAGPVVVTSSQEPEPELHKLSDCATECFGSFSAIKAGEQQELWNDNDPNVVESTLQEHDACQACGHVYSSHDERTTHIRRHPYHCQRCHLAFRSEVSAMYSLEMCHCFGGNGSFHFQCKEIEHVIVFVNLYIL